MASATRSSGASARARSRRRIDRRVGPRPNPNYEPGSRAITPPPIVGNPGHIRGPKPVDLTAEVNRTRPEGGTKPGLLVTKPPERSINPPTGKPGLRVTKPPIKKRTA